MFRQVEQNARLKRYVKISLVLHGAFFLSLLVGKFFGPSTTELFLPTVQIDMVALPDIVKAQNSPPIDTTLPVKDAPPPPPPPPKTEEAKDEPTPAPDKDAMALKKEKKRGERRQKSPRALTRAEEKRG